MTKEVKLKWYAFGQNNSGGYCIEDEMVAEWIFVQAPSAKTAVMLAEEITKESSYDWCECCGERWYIYARESDGYDFPTMFGRVVTEEVGYREGLPAILHYFSGKVQKIAIGKEFTLYD